MGTWSNTPSGGYSYTPGTFGSAPPGGTYVPSQMTPGAPGNVTPAHFEYPASCETCKKEKEKQDKKEQSQAMGKKLGTCTSATKSFGVVSQTGLTCTDVNGHTSYAGSVGYGVSQPGWSVASWDVYASSSAPPGTGLQDVVGGKAWQGGFLDNTSISPGSGYMLQTGGSPNIMSFERTNTTFYTK